MNLEDFADEYKKVESGEIRPFELMRKLGMRKATYYRYVNRCKQAALSTDYWTDGVLNFRCKQEVCF